MPIVLMKGSSAGLAERAHNRRNSARTAQRRGHLTVKCLIPSILRTYVVAPKLSKPLASAV